MKESNDQVRRKINNHNNKNIELIIKKKQESISLQHIPKNFKVLHSFAGYKRTSDNTRMTADNILNLYLTETQKTQNRKESDLTYDRFSCWTKITGVHIRGIQSHLPPDY